MKFDIKALIFSKIFWANVLGALIAIAAIFGIAPEMTGKTATYAAVIINIITIILRMFSDSPILKVK